MAYQIGRFVKRKTRLKITKNKETLRKEKIRKKLKKIKFRQLAQKFFELERNPRFCFFDTFRIKMTTFIAFHIPLNPYQVFLFFNVIKTKIYLVKKQCKPHTDRLQHNESCDT